MCTRFKYCKKNHTCKFTRWSACLLILLQNMMLFYMWKNKSKYIDLAWVVNAHFIKTKCATSTHPECAIFLYVVIKSKRKFVGLHYSGTQFCAMPHLHSHVKGCWYHCRVPIMPACGSSANQRMQTLLCWRNTWGMFAL